MINGLSGFDKDFGHRPGLCGTDHVVHLHRVKDRHLLAARDLIAAVVESLGGAA